jgi:hypothetical protein
VIARVITVFAFTFLIACEDKAEPGFKKCEQLEAKGQLEDALSTCEMAMIADPGSTFSKKSVEKWNALQHKLDETVPPTVTADWCSRLRKRLENRLAPATGAKYGQGASIQVLTEHIPDRELSCRQEIGQPTSGSRWACMWANASDLDRYSECDHLKMARE